MITSPTNLGLWTGARRYGPGTGRSRFNHLESRAGLRHKLPRTLVIVPVLLLLGRIGVFVKGHTDTDYGYIDSVAIVEIGLVAVTILLLPWDRATTPVLRTVSRSPVRWLMLYYVFATLSALWSLMPSYTLFRGVEVLSQFLAIFVILAHARDFIAREFTFLAVGAIAIAMDFAGTVRLVGSIGSIADIHTNSYCNVGLMLFIYCLAESPGCEPSRKRRLFWFGFIGLAAIVLGTSATTNVAAVLGILVAVIVSARKSGAQPLTVFAVCLLLFLGVSTMMARNTVITWLMPYKTVEQIENFTGRREMWDELSGLWRESPLIGRGFVASTRTPGLKLASAHNVLLQAMLDTGLVGTGILAVAMSALAISSIRQLNRGSPGSAGFVATLAALLPVNMTIPIWGAGWEKFVLAWAFLVGLHTFSSRHRNARTAPFATACERREALRLRVMSRCRL